MILRFLDNTKNSFWPSSDRFRFDLFHHHNWCLRLVVPIFLLFNSNELLSIRVLHSLRFTYKKACYIMYNRNLWTNISLLWYVLGCVWYLHCIFSTRMALLCKFSTIEFLSKVKIYRLKSLLIMNRKHPNFENRVIHIM